MDHHRLLIVEDEPDLRQVMKENLSRVSDNIEMAANGQEALAILKEKKFDAIVSDINMPFMSGLELLKSLREAGIQTPFVIVSAYDDKDRIHQSLKLGAFDFLPKPYKPIEFLGVIKRALEVGTLVNSCGEKTDFNEWIKELQKAANNDALLKFEKEKNQK